MKVKIFCEERMNELEKEINEWLAKNNIKIISLHQSERANYKITITILYE